MASRPGLASLRHASPVATGSSLGRSCRGAAWAAQEPKIGAGLCGRSRHVATPATSLPLALLAVSIVPHPNKVKTPKKKKNFGEAYLVACGFGWRA